MATNVLMLYAPNGASSPCLVLADIVRNLDRSQCSLTLAVDPAVDFFDGESAGDKPTDIVHPSLGSALQTLRAKPLGSMIELSSSFASLVALVRRKKIDVIHVNDDRVSMPVALALSAATRVPYLVHFHNLPGMHVSWRVRITQELSRRAACSVGCSRFIAREIARSGVPEDRVACIYNGSDVAKFNPNVDGRAVRRELGIADDAVVAMQMGRYFHAMKRQADFVRAVAIARAKDPRIVGVVVGWDDPRYSGTFRSYREELEALARDLGLGDSIKLLKARQDAPEMHAASDIAVLPSIGEPFGLVVTEAMATERPVIGASSGAVPEIISDGVDGYLVPEKSPEEIAKRLVELAARPDLRAAMGKRGRAKVVAQFRDARVAERFGRLYAAIAARRPIPADLALHPTANDPKVAPEGERAQP